MSYSHVARIYSYSFVNYLPEQDPATPNVIWPYKGDAHSYLGFYVSTVHPMRGDVQMPCSFDFGNMAMMNDTTWFQRVYPGVHLPRKTIGPWPQASLPLPNPEQGIPKPFSFMEFWKANGGEDGRVFSVGLLAPEGMGIASTLQLARPRPTAAAGPMPCVSARKAATLPQSCRQRTRWLWSWSAHRLATRR